MKVKGVVHMSVRKIYYILRPNRDQLRKMQLHGSQLKIEPATSGSLDQRFQIFRPSFRTKFAQ